MSSTNPRLRGRVEFHDQRMVKGWAIDDGAPDRVVRLRVFAGDRLLGEVVPAVIRWDLTPRGPGCSGFVFLISESLTQDGGVELHFRFAETGEELENSPVRTVPEGERLWVPFDTSDLTGSKVLVLAPHPDDESLACGGSLILHRQSDDPVKVVFLTDGARGDTRGAHDPAEYVDLRRREAREACCILGVSDLEFWGLPDRGLSEAHDALARLREVLEVYAPTLVYAPSPLEFHPDHRAAAQLLFRALQRPVSGARVALYELNRPINVNTLVNITQVLDRKRQACGAYRSQIRDLPYVEVAESLNRYRALTVANQAEYAEGFFLLSAGDVVGRTVDSVTAHQFRPLDRQLGGDAPVVSVVVRTLDRKELLRDALSSVLTQTYSNVEIVLVNDGGVDVSDVVEELQRFLPVHHVRHETTKGRSAAANAGVRRATGRYLMFLDDDDVLYPRHVEKLAGYLEASGERMAYSDCERVHYRWTGEGFEQVGDPQLFYGVDFDRDRLHHSNFIPFMTAMIRRDLAEETGSFDEALEYLEDWDFWIRASSRAAFQRLPGVTALYRTFGTHTHAASELDLFRKHSDYWTLERLKASTWPRIEALTLQNHQTSLRNEELEGRASRLEEENRRRALQCEALEQESQQQTRRNAELEQSVAGLKGELASAAAASERLGSEARRSLKEAQAARAELDLERRAHERTRHELRLVTGSYSFRATRLIPRPFRARLRTLLDRWKQRRANLAFAGGSGPRGEARPLAASEGNGYLIRPYEAGDEGQILELFADCFGHMPSLNHWRWKYIENPQGSRAISVALDQQGRLVAHYGAYPCRLIDATSGTPRSILAYQVGDTMTRDSARSVGRRSTSLLFRITRDFFDRYCEGQVGFNYGFNEGKIRRYYLRLVRGSRFFEPAPYRVLDLQRSRPAASDGECRVERVRELSEEWDELFDRVVPHYRFLTLRNREYAQWRYLDAPDVDYQLYAARCHDQLVGWAVFRRQEDRLVWGDALFDPQHPDAVEAVLGGALGAPEHRDVTRVDGWLSTNPAWWARLIEDLGFESHPDPQDLGMIFLPFEEPDPLERFQAALYYTKGDGDLF